MFVTEGQVGRKTRHLAAWCSQHELKPAATRAALLEGCSAFSSHVLFHLDHSYDSGKVSPQCYETRTPRLREAPWAAPRKRGAGLP